VVRSQDTGDVTPLVSKAYNRNPDSTGSINYLNRTFSKTITLNTATSKAEMDVMAQSELEKASGFNRKLSLSHLFDPRLLTPRVVLGLTLTDSEGNVVVDGRWSHNSCNLPLTRPATPMTSEVSRIEEV
jgi:hypothetical protein